MGPADREKVRLECNQFFPERCINMMARQLGKGEGPTTVPKPSELSGEGHDGATGPGRLTGGGVAATGVEKRRHWRQWGLEKQRSRHQTCLYASSCLHLIPISHCIIPSLKPSMVPSYPPHIKVPVLTHTVISCVILGMSPPLPVSVSSSVKQDDHYFPTSWIWCKNLEKGPAVSMLLPASNRKTHVTCFNIKKHFSSYTTNH